MGPACILLLSVGLQAATGAAPAASALAKADQLLGDGITAQRKHDYRSAIDDYRKALALNPGLAEALANLGAALSATGDFDAAIEVDTRAMAVAPDKIAVRRNLALAYYKKGDMQHAQTEFEAVHAARPSDVSSAVLLGYTYVKLQKQAEAVRLLAPLEHGRESDMDFEYVLAEAMIESGKGTEGLERMEKVASATRSVDAYFIAGSERMRKSQFKEARVDLDAGLQLNPAFPGLYTLAGQAHDATGDSDGSIPLFEAALRADPRDATANLYLGVILLKKRDFDRARPLLEQALALRPGNPLTRLQLAKLNVMTGKYPEAAATLEDLEKNEPKWLDPHVELAALYYKLHRPEDGKRERDIVQQIEDSQQKAGPPKD